MTILQEHIIDRHSKKQVGDCQKCKNGAENDVIESAHSKSQNHQLEVLNKILSKSEHNMDSLIAVRSELNIMINELAILKNTDNKNAGKEKDNVNQTKPKNSDSHKNESDKNCKNQKTPQFSELKLNEKPLNDNYCSE